MLPSALACSAFCLSLLCSACSSTSSCSSSAIAKGSIGIGYGLRAPGQIEGCRGVCHRPRALVSWPENWIRSARSGRWPFCAWRAAHTVAIYTRPNPRPNAKGRAPLSRTSPAPCTCLEFYRSPLSGGRSLGPPAEGPSAVAAVQGRAEARKWASWRRPGPSSSGKPSYAAPSRVGRGPGGMVGGMRSEALSAQRE